MSGVSYDVLSQFAKLVNKDKKTNVETTVYGTIVEDGAGNKYVKIDGTDQLTPFNVMPTADSTTVAVDVNDRVSVSIKNHTATVTGNMSSPAAKNSDVQSIKQFDIVITDRIQAVEAVVEDLDVENLEAIHAAIEDLEAAKAKITELEAVDVTITGKLTAVEAEIENLEATKIDADVVDAQYIDITGKLTAVNASISNLEAQKASIEDLNAVNANINNLEAANATITGKITAAEADIDNLEANKASVTDLNAVNANISKLNADKADIDFANVKTLEGVVAIIQDLLRAGHIITEDLDAVAGNFTSYLTGVRIVGDIIEGNTIKAKSLILVDDENGLYYQLNANSLGIDTVKLDKEKYSNALDGSAIVEKSITAQKITVEDLVAFGAKIADFTITPSDSKTAAPGTIYSGTKSGVNQDNSRGIYLDSHGQFAVGDSDNFLKFYKDTDGTHKLAIQAQKITFGSGKKNVETAINDAQNTANTVQTNLNNLKVGGRNYLLDSEGEQFNTAASRAEYLKTTFDLAPFFDENGLIEVTLSFDAYAPVAGNVQVYCQNGSGSRYSFTKFVSLTTDWQRCSVTFTPDGPNEAFIESYLAFYGTYDSGVIPHVRKLKLEKGNKATDWSPAQEDVDAGINNAQSAADAAQATANANASDLTNYISATNLALENMQGQIDGSITTWFYEVAPTTSNAPAKDWTTTDLKNIHLGDLYYDTITGYCYRWQVVNNVYSWQLVKDTDVTKALEDASKAKDTADKKRQVFTVTPTPPYDVGDLWVQGSAGDIMRCQTKKTASQTYAASDWIKASKYTDDTAATNAQNTANNAQNTANNAQSDIDNLEIGARNLALNSDEEVSNNDYMFTAYSLSSPLVEGETYTATIRVTPAPGVSYYGLYLSSGYRPMGRFTVSGTEEQTISLTFTAGYAEGKTPEDDLQNAQNSLYRFPNDNTVTENSIIHWYKVEKGNRATDWSPAPEDVDDSISNVQDSANDAQYTANGAQSSADNAQSTADAAQEKADENAIQIAYLDGLVQKIQDYFANAVIGEDGTTVLEQTGDGWRFNFSDLSGRLNDLDDKMISALEYKGHISFEKDDNDNPYIIIAANQTGLKLKLTASSIEFLDASDKSLVDILSSDKDGDVGLTTDKINVVEELTHDDFVWKVRKNGNFGLSWKG